MGSRRRRAARVLVVDPDERLLLLEGHDSTLDDDGSWWFTVGGGLEPGESLREGALRELAEETGAHPEHPDELVGPVWHRVAEFVFEGEDYHQEESFFLWRPAGAIEVAEHGWAPMEQRSLLGHRWWSVADLMATDAVVFPAHLGPLLADLLRDGPPPKPITLPADPPR